MDQVSKVKYGVYNDGKTVTVKQVTEVREFVTKRWTRLYTLPKTNGHPIQGLKSHTVNTKSYENRGGQKSGL